MSERTFDEILQSKMREKSTRKTPSHTSHSLEGWWAEVDWHHSVLPPQAFPYSSTKTFNDSEQTKATDEKRSETKPAKIQWSFEQQLAIDQLIRLGAPIRLSSNYDEIKKGYRAVVRTFHPDFHHNLPMDQQREMSERLQLAITAFQIIEKEKTL